MARKQPSRDAYAGRGLLARPLEALCFLLPLIVFYEVMSLVRPNRVIAFDLMRRFFELFGDMGMWAPGIGVIAILLATHIASGHRWTIRLDRVGLMYVEAIALAVPLFVVNWALAPLTSGPEARSTVDEIALGIGAGVYEELVFRLLMISLVVMIGIDLLRLGRAGVTAAAILLSALAFAAHHHPPIGLEPFEVARFTFRTVAGAYLALIFWYRGYGLAAGCHAAYNVALACMGTGGA